MKARSLVFSVVTLILAMASIQIGASVAKQLFPVVGAIGATTLRLFFAALILFSVWRPYRGALSGRDVLFVSLYGASLGIMNLLFYLALERIPLGIAVALEFTGPLGVALFASKKWTDLVWAGLAILGIYLIMPVATASVHLDRVGVVFALGAGACWASYILFGQRAVGRLSEGRVTSLGMCVAMIVVLPFGLAHSAARLFNWEVIPLAIAVAVLSSALPYSLEMISLKRLPTKTFGILMSLEPALAALSGLFLLSERLTLLQWAAIGCVIAASLGSSLTIRGQHKLSPDVLPQ